MKPKEKNKNNSSQNNTHESIPSGDDFSALDTQFSEAEKDHDVDDVAASRIARAGQKVLAETMRLFTQEPFPQKKSRIPFAEGWGAIKDITASLSDVEKASLVEVTDQNDRPLLCMPPETAITQNLRYRLVAVALRTPKNRIVLHKGRDKRLGYAQCWDVYTGFVFVGEAREDAAQRILHAMALSGIRLQQIGILKPTSENRGHCTFLGGELPSGLYPVPFDAEKDDGGHSRLFMEMEKKESLLELDRDELMGLVKQAPELFSPELLWAAEAGILFHKKKAEFS